MGIKHILTYSFSPDGANSRDHHLFECSAEKKMYKALFIIVTRMEKAYLFNYLGDRRKQESCIPKSNVFLEVLPLVKIFPPKMNDYIKKALMSIKL